MSCCEFVSQCAAEKGQVINKIGGAFQFSDKKEKEQCREGNVVEYDEIIERMKVNARWYTTEYGPKKMLCPKSLYLWLFYRTMGRTSIDLHHICSITTETQIVSGKSIDDDLRQVVNRLVVIHMCN